MPRGTHPTSPFLRTSSGSGEYFSTNWEKGVPRPNSVFTSWYLADSPPRLME